MFILKLGGSVITDKTRKCCFKEKVVDNLASEIRRSNKEAILIHGAGSFGHILAKQYNLNEGYIQESQIKGFSLTHEMVQRLNSLVLQSLHKNDISAVSISPHSIIKLNNHKLEKMNYKIFEEYLEKKFTPVTFGDVVLDKKLGFSICSGDLLVNVLTEYFKPEKVVFVIDEDGLYTANPKIDKNAKLISSATHDELEEFSTSSDKHADVTRGMSGKIDVIRNITKLGIDTILVNGNKQGRLYNILVRKDTKCSIIHGGK